jgi:hypothetical protein
MHLRNVGWGEQSVEGGFLLFARCVVALYFIYSVWRTQADELLREKKLFYRWFGGVYATWLFALPLCVAILCGVSSLVRRQALVAVTSTVDAVAYSVMLYLIWPGRTQPFFKIAPPAAALLSATAAGDDKVAPATSQYGAIE